MVYDCFMFSDEIDLLRLRLAYLAKRERNVNVSYGEDIECALCEKPIAFHNLSIREMYMLQGGVMPRTPAFFAKVFDKITMVVTQKFHSRSIMNRLSRLAFEGRWSGRLKRAK